MNLTLSIRSFLSKLNFLLGNKPKIIHYPYHVISKSIPQPHKAVIIFSCDFELIWAWRFAKQIDCDLEKAKILARRERENITLVLNLCDKFNVPISWAIVGHLFINRCSVEDGMPHRDMPRLENLENKYWKFSSGDWFDGDPCCDWQNALEWYAPDLIEKITGSSVKHEIACHTFSHIDCRQVICPTEVLKKEIKECKKLASKCGAKLESFVFPGNFMGNLAVLKEEGFRSYRLDKDILGFPKKDKYGLWQIPTTAEIGKSSYDWSIDYYIKRYKIIIERAIKHQRLCHFWFHPSQDRDFLEKVLDCLYEFLDINRDKLYITTMNGYIKYLENGTI